MTGFYLRGTSEIQETFLPLQSSGKWRKTDPTPVEWSINPQDLQTAEYNTALE